MKIILANGLELEPILVTGSKRTVQGANRDTLTFVFPENVSLDEIDNVFSAENCESVKLVNDEGEFVYNGYTIRAELKRTPTEVIVNKDTGEIAIENRVSVSMSERTYAETQMADMRESLELLLSGDTGEDEPVGEEVVE